MGKAKKISLTASAVDQVMDELNEEIKTSKSSPSFFISEIPDLTDEEEGVDQEGVAQDGAIQSGKPVKISDKQHIPDPKIDDSNDFNTLKKIFSSISGIQPKMDNKIKSLEKADVNKVSKEEKGKVKSKLDKKASGDGDLKTKVLEDQTHTQVMSITSAGLKSSTKLLKSAVLKSSEPLKNTPSQNMPKLAPTSFTLRQSENLRLAQNRIIALEEEIERLRTDSEELLATSDIFKDRLDIVLAQNDNLKKIYEESRQEFQDEKQVLMDTLSEQRRKMEKAESQNKDLKKRLSSNIHQIRFRERELENRLELMKVDNQTLLREKNQYILDLKRQIDKLKMDNERKENKYDEMSKKIEEYRDQNRRVARGLQMILNIAKGNVAQVENIVYSRNNEEVQDNVDPAQKEGED